MQEFSGAITSQNATTPKLVSFAGKTFDCAITSQNATTPKLSYALLA